MILGLVLWKVNAMSKMPVVRSGFNALHKVPQSSVLLNPDDFFLFLLVIEQSVTPSPPALARPM